MSNNGHYAKSGTVSCIVSVIRPSIRPTAPAGAAAPAPHRTPRFDCRRGQRSRHSTYRCTCRSLHAASHFPAPPVLGPIASRPLIALTLVFLVNCDYLSTEYTLTKGGDRIKSATLLIVVLCVVLTALFLSSCSWTMFTEGKIDQGNEILQEEIDEIKAEEIRIGSELYPIVDSPDSMNIRVFSQVSIDSQTYELVEMEVGELKYGTGTELDTLIIDHRP